MEILPIDLGLLIGLISIAIALYFGLRGIPHTLNEIKQNMRKIEQNASALLEPIKKIEEIVTRLDERIDTVLRFLPLRGTVELTLKNVGKVEVSAEPSEDHTDYLIKTEKPILKVGFISKKSKETNLVEKEKELFGREVVAISIDPARMVLRIPSTNPKTCVKYLTLFLKWLDSTYWESLKEVKEYEKITL